VTDELALCSEGWYEFSPMGLTILEAPSYEEWAAEFQGFQRLRLALPWIIGDMINAGDKWFGDESAQAIDATGLAAQSLYNYASVCGRIPIEDRQPGLSFSRHAAVAYLEPDKREQLLSQAVDEDLTTADLRAEVKAIRGTDKPTLDFLPDAQNLPPTVESRRDDRAMALSYAELSTLYKYLSSRDLLPADLVHVLDKIETMMLAV